MDELTEKLIIQLQIEDVLTMQAKGKGRANGKSDADLAFELYQQELVNNAAINSDRLMTRSIAHAVETDGVILFGDFEREDLIARDHAAARSGEIPDFPTEFDEVLIGAAQIVDDEVLEKLKAKYMDESKGIPGSGGLNETQEECMENGESSKWAASRKVSNPIRSLAADKVDRPCASCGDDINFFDLARVPCGHEYCRACLQELFRLAMLDESLFPPRCCRQHITLGSVRMWLETELALSFYKKKIEMDAPDKTYCSNQKCSEFIRPEHIANDIATCPKCATRTCTMCKAAAHRGDCPNDVGLQQVLQVAEENMWKRCYNCSRVVELAMGCTHITCRCRAEFCYICSRRWKTCECALWDEQLLYGRANVLVDREVARQQVGVPQYVVPPGNQQQVQARPRQQMFRYRGDVEAAEHANGELFALQALQQAEIARRDAIMREDDRRRQLRQVARRLAATERAPAPVNLGAPMQIGLQTPPRPPTVPQASGPGESATRASAGLALATDDERSGDLSLSVQSEGTTSKGVKVNSDSSTTLETGGARTPPKLSTSKSGSVQPFLQHSKSIPSPSTSGLPDIAAKPAAEGSKNEIVVPGPQQNHTPTLTQTNLVSGAMTAMKPLSRLVVSVPKSSGKATTTIADDAPSVHSSESLSGLTPSSTQSSSKVTCPQVIEKQKSTSSGLKTNTAELSTNSTSFSQLMRKDINPEEDTKPKNPAVISAGDRDQLVAEAVDRLTANHECEHK